MTSASRTQRGTPASVDASKNSAPQADAGKGNVQLKASLRGQGFAAQEALLAPGADLGGGVISGEPSPSAAEAPAPEGPAQGAPKTGADKPVQAKGLLSNLRGGGWKVSGSMPQYELDDGWHGSVFATGAKGPDTNGLFFDGFHLTWGKAPQGSAPHIFYKHDGTPEVGKSTNHGQTKGYRARLAGKTIDRTGTRRWPELDTVISTADSKAAGVASTLGEELTRERELELEEEAKTKAKEKREQEELDRQNQTKGAWAELENDKGKDQSVVQWMQTYGIKPNEYRWFGDPTKGAARREQEELKHPEIKKAKVEETPTVVEDTPVETTVEETPVEGTTPEGTGESVVEDETPTLDTPTVTPTPEPTKPKGGGPKPKVVNNAPKNQPNKKKGKGKFKKKKNNRKK